MTSCEKIYSRFLGLITDYKLATLPKEDILEMEQEWLRAVISKPRIRRLFTVVKMTDDLLDFSLKTSIDIESDEDFVVELLAMGMSIEWLQQQVDNVINTAPMIGGKEEKKLIDNHKYSIQRLSEMKRELKLLIRDRGYLNNSYISGDR